jgi:hypothetical protein
MEKKKPLVIRQTGTGQDLIDLLEWQEKSFTVTKTSNTTKVDIKDEKTGAKVKYFFSIEEFSMTHLHYIKKIRDEINGNLDKIKGMKPGDQLLDIKYHAFANRMRVKHEGFTLKHYKNVAEADITKAYYQTARNLGLISDEFYRECLNLPKNERLRLLGTIATQKFVSEYKNGKRTKIDIKVDKDLRRAWFIICDHVAEVMTEISEKLGSSFLFYWVDGIYFTDTQKARQVIRKSGEKYNFEWKFIQVEEMTALNKEGVVEIMLIKEGEKKVFYPPADKIYKYF